MDLERLAQALARLRRAVEEGEVPARRAEHLAGFMVLHDLPRGRATEYRLRSWLRDLDLADVVPSEPVPKMRAAVLTEGPQTVTAAAAPLVNGARRPADAPNAPGS